jgi:type II secretory pathway pseudopilin PulG
MINKIKKKLRGFTIIETLIAILLLSTAIVGPITIAAKGLTAALESRDQLTAFYLAQDAIEYARYARDTNTLMGADWLSGLESASEVGINLTPCEGSTGCQMNSLGQSADSSSGDPSVVACGISACSKMYYETATGDYDYNFSGRGTTAGTAFFVRTVKLTNPDGSTIGSEPTEVELTVSVAWRDPTGPRSISVREDLFNWQ